MYWTSQSVKNWFFLAGQLGMETYNSQPVHIEWNDTVTGPSANNSYNSILAKLGWLINNGELSSQLADQQWVKSLKGLEEGLGPKTQNQAFVARFWWRHVKRWCEM